MNRYNEGRDARIPDASASEGLRHRERADQSESPAETSAHTCTGGWISSAGVGRKRGATGRLPERRLPLLLIIIIAAFLMTRAEQGIYVRRPCCIDRNE